MIVFDIDQTLVDSTIRENMARCHHSGSLNLPEYIRLKSLVSLDTTLPLGLAFKELKASVFNSSDWRILTARTFCSKDYASLSSLLGLTPSDFSHRVINRNNIANLGGNPLEQDSGLYKEPVLSLLAKRYGPLTVIDDCPSVLGLVGAWQAISAYDFYALAPAECKSRILSL